MAEWISLFFELLQHFLHIVIFRWNSPKHIVEWIDHIPTLYMNLFNKLFWFRRALYLLSVCHFSLNTLILSSAAETSPWSLPAISTPIFEQWLLFSFHTQNDRTRRVIYRAKPVNCKNHQLLQIGVSTCKTSVVIFGRFRRSQPWSLKHSRLMVNKQIQFHWKRLTGFHVLSSPSSI